MRVKTDTKAKKLVMWSQSCSKCDTQLVQVLLKFKVRWRAEHSRRLNSLTIPQSLKISLLKKEAFFSTNKSNYQPKSLPRDSVKPAQPEQKVESRAHKGNLSKQ